MDEPIALSVDDLSCLRWAIGNAWVPRFADPETRQAAIVELGTQLQTVEETEADRDRLRAVVDGCPRCAARMVLTPEALGKPTGKHMIERTNPMGERPFIGRCRYCGTEGLPIEGALLDCAAAPDAGTSLLDALDGDPLDVSEDMGGDAEPEPLRRLRELGQEAADRATPSDASTGHALQRVLYEVDRRVWQLINQLADDVTGVDGNVIRGWLDTTVREALHAPLDQPMQMWTEPDWHPDGRGTRQPDSPIVIMDDDTHRPIEG